MLLTMRSLNEESANVVNSSAGDVMSSMAHGALLGARGNSGVILSQFFSGMAQGFKCKDTITAKDLGLGLQLASKAAYNAVGKPVEGTILTVINNLSLTAQECLRSEDVDLSTLLNSVVKTARHTVSQTPLQLTVLREAGVVDAGGQGLAIILEAVFHSLNGRDVDSIHIDLCDPSQGQSSDPTHIEDHYLIATENEIYGYCVQFLLRGEALGVDQVRQDISKVANSTVVVGDASLIKVHAHSLDPGPTISCGASFGTISQVHIENIDEQHEEFVASHRRQSPPQGIGVVGVIGGQGFDSLFRELGCTETISGGQTMNPSTKALLGAAERTGATHIIILPNNSNIVPAAEQAASMSESEVYVIPSTSLPQGIAAMLAYNPGESIDRNLDAMRKALATVKTIEVTQAVRDSHIADRKIIEGQFMSLVDGRLTTVGDHLQTVLFETLQGLGDLTGRLATLYWGDNLLEDDVNRTATYLQEHLPQLEVEVVEGGQPLYPYIASLE